MDVFILVAIFIIHSVDCFRGQKQYGPITKHSITRDRIVPHGSDIILNNNPAVGFVSKVSRKGSTAVWGISLRNMLAV